MNEKNKFNEYRNDLTIICSRGYTQLNLWKKFAIYFIKNKDVFMLSPTIFAFTRDALLECAVSDLIKLFDTHGDSLSIYKYLNFCDQNKTKLFSTDKQVKIVQAVNEDKLKLKNKENDLNNLKAWRDKRLYHLDKKYAGDLNKVFRDFNLTIGQIEDLFLLTKDILNRYSNFYDGSSSIMKYIKIDIEFDDLIRQLTSGKTAEIIDRLRILSKMI